MKRLVIIAAILMAGNALLAQGTEFMHSIGGKYFFYGNSDGLTGGAIVYSPRLNLTGTENSALSVGTHLGLGFSLQSGPYGSSSSLILDFPVVGEYNFGYGSTMDAEGGIGGYVGAGYGFHRVSQTIDGYSGHATLNGPVFTGGVRFDAGMIGSFEIGASYMLDLKSKDQKTNIFGISISYLLGMGGGGY